MMGVCVDLNATRSVEADQNRDVIIGTPRYPLTDFCCREHLNIVGFGSNQSDKADDLFMERGDVFLHSCVGLLKQTYALVGLEDSSRS